METAGNHLLRKGERLALWLPFIGGAVFGLGPLFPRFFASIFGFSGNDGYIYQLAGAATFGYAVALWYAIKGNSMWEEIRLVVIATLVFNIVSIYVCLSAIFAGGAPWVVYAIVLTSIAIVAITGTLLHGHRGKPNATPNVSGGVLGFLSLTTISAFVFGILPLFSAFSANLFGYKGTDAFIYGQAGAATLGYAVMALYGFGSKNYRQIRLPLLMAAVFNALAFLSSVYQFIIGQQMLLVYLIALASLAFAIGLFSLYQKAGKIS